MSQVEIPSHPHSGLSVGAIVEDLVYWIKTRGPWWLASVTVHTVIMVAAMFLLGTIVAPVVDGVAPSFESTQTEPVLEPVEIKDFEVGETPIEPSDLTTDTLTMTEQAVTGGEEQINGPADEAFEEGDLGGGIAGAVTDLNGISGFDVKALGPGPKVTGKGGVGAGRGEGDDYGRGGAGSGFKGRGQRKSMVAKGGGTKASERAVAAALNWLARHQNRQDGSWSLDGFQRQCKDGSCTGKGNGTSAGATALALLPFLGAGQTHYSKGPYQTNIKAGVNWLIANQDKTTGNLAKGETMYSHGLAAICLCEAFALSGDSLVGAAAQRGLHYIEQAQHTEGGWRYTPNEPGDTSVVGWQVMALKSGKMGGLAVTDVAFDGSSKFLKSVSSGQYGGTFTYMPGGPPTPAMSSVGLLCHQYLGMGRQDPVMVNGVKFLMANLPDANRKEIYYWYYATQVMHNVPGYEWDEWNRRMRKILIESQSKNGCAAGSWDPAGHPHQEAGGRIFVTSLSCLTLEIYYRYLPLYKLDGGGKDAKARPAGK